MLRMSEVLGAKNPLTPGSRRPVRVSDIDPVCAGQPTYWGPQVDEIALRVSGSKTDWLSQGCVRPHSKVAPGAHIEEICVVKALIDLRALYLAEITRNAGSPLATWRNGDRSNPATVTAMLRSVVSMGGGARESIPYTPYGMGRYGALLCDKGRRVRRALWAMGGDVFLGLSLGNPPNGDGPERFNGRCGSCFTHGDQAGTFIRQ